MGHPEMALERFQAVVAVVNKTMWDLFSAIKSDDPLYLIYDGRSDR